MRACMHGTVWENTQQAHVHYQSDCMLPCLIALFSPLCEKPSRDCRVKQQVKKVQSTYDPRSLSG